MTVSAERFRDVLGWLAGGVCVIATRDREGRPRGLTATAVCSVSLDPPLVLVCLSSGSRTHDAITASGFFAVTFLGAQDSSVADRFAGDDQDKFGGVPTREMVTGAPVLEAGLACCDCVVVKEVAAGDHTVFFGRVEAADISEPADGSVAPLLRYRGAYLMAAGTERESALGPGPDRD
ncbi:MAG: flavin reductase family protein [Gemmatimonadales bacterium]|jgi:flavin reductase (DIM6/NTAB) family NADH-FMN oxidoreductase RutF